MNINLTSDKCYCYDNILCLVCDGYITRALQSSSIDGY